MEIEDPRGRGESLTLKKMMLYDDHGRAVVTVEFPDPLVIEPDHEMTYVHLSANVTLDTRRVTAIDADELELFAEGFAR